MRPVPPTVIGRTLRAGFVLTMLGGGVLIAHACLAYVREGDMHPFVLEKLPLAHERIWMAALYVHLVTAPVAMLGCLVLTAPALVRKLPRVHRWLGRFVGLAVLAAVVPSGVFLAFTARGGLASTIGFLASGAIVAWAMVGAIVAARHGRFAEHRRYTAHVVAQMSVAATSRIMLVALSAASFEGENAYVAALWLPVVASALIAESMFAARVHPPARASGRNHESFDSRRLRLDPAR